MDIRDIARLSGYGVGTVSRVLNGHPNVSERARERVLAVVAEQGYEPNGNARYLKLQAKASIAVMVKGASNLLFADLLERIQARLEERGEECHAVYLGEDEDEVREALSYSRTMHPKGYLFLGGDPACFKRGFSGIRVPSVLLTNSAAGFGFSNLSSFSTDDAAAAARVVDELVEAGHHRIGIIGGNREIGQVSQIRIQAAVDRLAHHGISFDFDRDYEPGHYTMDEGYQAAVRLLMRTSDITALFALSDVIAFGTLRAVCDMGRRVPDNISVAGFDGIELSQFCIPRLTTVRQDTARLAALGVDTLLASIENRATPPVHQHVPFTLYRRESVRRLTPSSRKG